MVDIVPELWEKIEKEFNRLYNEDKRIQRFLSQAEKGTAVSEDAAKYAMYLGECASGALRKHLTMDVLPDGKMYWNIADRTIRPLLKKVHRMVNDAAKKVIDSENEKKGIGIKAVSAPFPKERVDDLISKLADMTLTEETTDEE